MVKSKKRKIGRNRKKVEKEEGMEVMYTGKQNSNTAEATRMKDNLEI
jgi:hypothetical protein